MRMYDIIHKKREGGELTTYEIHFFVQGYTQGEIPDYQASALLMAIFFRGMTQRETAALTLEMARSGDMVDLSSIPGVKVDKHSTGGVGDKTSLILGPIAAACGVKIAKMSGRGLGHTGGTVDKLESIPGLRTDIPRQEFFRIVQEVGLSIIGQSGNLCPADKKLYALRDVTATVESLPLIASSIMSKKIAAGADAILLDVKMGSGAFMKTLEDSRALAREMVRIGSQVGGAPWPAHRYGYALGQRIGNALEVRRRWRCSPARGPPARLVPGLSANAGYLGARPDMPRPGQGRGGRALRRGPGLRRMVEAQGGGPLYHPEKFTISPACVKSPHPKGMSPLGRRRLRPGGGGAGVAGRPGSPSTLGQASSCHNKGDRVGRASPSPGCMPKARPSAAGGRSAFCRPWRWAKQSRKPAPCLWSAWRRSELPAKNGNRARRLLFSAFCLWFSVGVLSPSSSGDCLARIRVPRRRLYQRAVHALGGVTGGLGAKISAASGGTEDPRRGSST
ncbi:MAG: thymidine phosphorylase [Acutalibacter sp.]